MILFRPYDEVIAVVGAHNIHNTMEVNFRARTLKFIRHQNYDMGLINYR